MVALLTTTELGTLDYGFQAAPFCDGVESTGLDLSTMDVAFLGQPFVTNPGPTSISIEEDVDISDTVVTNLVLTIEEDFSIDDSTSIIGTITGTESLAIDDTDVFWNLNLTIEEPIAIEDDLVPLVVVDEEDINISDDTSVIGTISGEEDLSISDDVVVFYSTTVTIDEGLQIQDSENVLVSQTITDDESVGINESETLKITITVDEGLSTNDSIIYSFILNRSYTVKISTPIIITGSFTTNINVLNSIFTPVVDVQSDDNPFTPTIVLDGAYYAQNVATDPGGDISQINRLIVVNEAGIISNNALCDVFNYSVNLDFMGGSYSIYALHSFSGSSGNIFGLDAQFFEHGTFAGNQGVGYVTKGIFGDSIKLNRHLPLLDFIPQFKQGIYASNVVTNINDLNNLLSAKDIAIEIASKVGVALNWNIHNYYLLDAYPTSALTPLEAINFLAGKIGGTLVWHGGSEYSVIYLDQGLGQWTPPDCRLLGPSGSEVTELPDLISATLFNPIKQTLNVGGAPINLSAAQNEIDKVLPLGSFRTAPPDEAPVYYVGLPADWKKVKIRIDSTNGDISSPYKTSNPDEWFDLVERGSGSWQQYVFSAVDGTQKIQLPQTLFPSQEGTYTLNIGYSRDLTISTQLFEEAAALSQALNRLYDTGQSAVQYVKVGSATAQYFFHGTLPMPGMKTTITTVNGGSLTGIIESVSLASPGFLTINVSKYKRIEMLQLFTGVQQTSLLNSYPIIT